MIRNIIFDMGHVLMWFDREFFMERHAKDLSDEEKKLLMHEVYLSYEWICHDRGTVTTEHMVEIFKSRLPEKLHPAAEALVTRWDEDILPVEGMADLVKEMKEKGYHIYLLSNAGDDHPRYWHKVPGSEYFDDICVSAFEGYIKPQPELYERAVEKFGIVPEETVFIDDVPANVEASVNAGMHGIVFHGDMEELRSKLEAVTG